MAGIKGKGQNVAIVIRNSADTDLVHIVNENPSDGNVGFRTNIEHFPLLIRKNGGTEVIQLSSGTSYLGGFNCKMSGKFYYLMKSKE